MKLNCQIAFKEWAVIVRAIAEGKQSVILRKGGIHETYGEFKVDYDEFFLFPTYEHQNSADLKPFFAGELQCLPKNSPDEVRIENFVRVKKVIKITDETELAKVSDLHVWSDSAVTKKFLYGKEKALYLLHIEPYRLKTPILIPNLSRYAGCRSWVELEEPISLESASQV